MLVHQSNRSCACCGTSVEASIVDIPIQGIKLAPLQLNVNVVTSMKLIIMLSLSVVGEFVLVF